ncbi:hypothetical protein Ctob_010755 [Chrysochromulina tobinii]|uniref:Uncharacterized protein n=1 Tax=Chrysochromulina tobinii TaxID=1460289 RepID=A0A0M0K559_9EUKA|nr:hypothetical protein Ctob_010755 [Chrysochromulina tobinii]|eukprot:KOO33940.1 hypothetical protein Ctob_010755 [Chrysochromulina sp. CCMP291]
MTSVMRFAALLLALIVQCDGLVLGARSASLAPRTSLVRLEAPPPPPKGKLGATIDQDGKSNVWAVEPSMKVDKKDKGLMAFAPVAGVAVLALLAIPLLPSLFAANPDQV